MATTPAVQMSPEVDRILREGRERREAEARERRLDFWAERTDIPDLEFDTPKCPACRLHTECDGDGFYCDGCAVWWPMNGYGHQARRETV